MVLAPHACTLPTAEQPFRLAEFATLFATALRHADRLDATRLRLTLEATDEREAATRDLTARESQCCSFFAFTITRAGAVLNLDVQVPGVQIDVLDAIAALAQEALASRPSTDPT